MAAPLEQLPVILATADTPQKVTTTNSLKASSIIFKNRASNAGKLYLGNSSIAIATDPPIEVGDSINVSGQRLELSDFWFDGDNTGDILDVFYVPA